MKKIVLASNNKHKIIEFKQIFTDYEIMTMKDAGFTDDIEENGKDFYENSKIKAQAVVDFLKNKGIKADVVADDTGLCVNSLNGEPGLRSARYSGDHDDKRNREKLLMNLKDKDDRSAYFICVLTMIRENGEVITAEGRTLGHIEKEEKGDNGFGYDCLFYSDELKKTFGESSSDEKNRVSHRGKAIMELVKKMK